MSENKTIVLELNEVSLSYHSSRKSFDQGKHHVLQEVSMRLYDGEALGIIGKNGVGKNYAAAGDGKNFGAYEGQREDGARKVCLTADPRSWFQARSFWSQQCASCSDVAGIHPGTGDVVSR